jgi:hypothetical protein
MLRAPLTGLLTALALVAAMLGQGYAQVRAPASARLELVLCADGAERTIQVDARGVPVEPGHCAEGLCPDCIPTPPLALAAGPATAPGAPRLARDEPPPPVAGAATHRWSAPLPRGPPSPV